MPIEKLDRRKHDRRSFSCGIPELDDYLKKRANQELKENIAVSYVFCTDGQTVAGFYTLSSISIITNDLPESIGRKLPKYPNVPAILIGRLAVDGKYKGQRYGEHLLMDALYRSYRHSREIASMAVVIELKNKEAQSFYEKYGFQIFPENTEKMFITMKEVRDMFGFF